MATWVGSVNSSVGDIQHLVVTRFNCRIGDTARGLDDRWLARRLHIFERICVPSVRAQTAPHEWVVLADVGTPTRWKAKIEELARGTYRIEWVCGEFSPGLVRAFVERSPARIVISTRLDSDDALAPWTLERVQQIANTGYRGVVTMPIGQQISNDVRYWRLYVNNPFISLVEHSQRQRRGVYGVNHWDLSPERKRVVWSLKPAWYQLLHDDNLANEIRGIRVADWKHPLRSLRHQVNDLGDLAQTLRTEGSAFRRFQGGVLNQHRRDPPIK